MTVLLECFVKSVCFIRVFSGALHMKVWVSIIRTFRLSEHTQVPTRPDKRGSTVQAENEVTITFCFIYVLSIVQHYIQKTVQNT